MGSSVTLEEPRADLQDSYRDLIREFREASEKLIPFPLTFPNVDFQSFLDRLDACKRGEGVPPGYAPHSTYFLVSDGVVVGVSNLRHTLTDALRREGGHIGFGIRPSARRRGFAYDLLMKTLEKARELGLREAWLHCVKGNAGSVRTILKAGGVWMSEEFLSEHGEVIERYRINLDRK